jgi:hypothetical protein
MPRVTFVKAAQKDNPVCSKGESYYWWKFRFGGKHFSLTPPRGSQLTQSAYYGAVRGMCESIEDQFSAGVDVEGIEGITSDIASQLGELADEARESLENMPEGLQQGDTGQLLEERADTCESSQSEIEGIDIDFQSELDDEDEDVTDDDREQEKQDWLSDIQNELTDMVSACEI